jgi:hypothetical protein
MVFMLLSFVCRLICVISGTVADSPDNIDDQSEETLKWGLAREKPYRKGREERKVMENLGVLGVLRGSIPAKAGSAERASAALL